MIIMLEQPLKPDTPAPQRPAPQSKKPSGDVSDSGDRTPEDDPDIHPAPPPTDPQSAS
jgi:hypothetical protein